MPAAIMGRAMLMMLLACMVAAQPPPSSDSQVAAEKAADAAKAEEAAEKQDVANAKQAAVKAQAAEASLANAEAEVAKLKANAKAESEQAEEAADSAEKSSADSKNRFEGAQTPTAIGVLKQQVLQVLNDPHYQKAIAAIALVLGGCAVVQGVYFYQIMVFAAMFAGSYITVLSQAAIAFSGPNAIAMKHAASFLTACFVVFTAYKGWEGVQILLGGAFGLYVYSEFHGLTSILCGKTVAEDPITVVFAGALSVLLGLWALHEKYGAGRVLGVLCPALGSTLLVSAFGFIWMYAIAHTKKSVPQSFPVTPSDVPSVFQFWSMIVDPFHSEAVGYFKTEHINQVGAEGEHVQTDRFLCILLSLFIFFVTAKSQLRRDTHYRQQWNSELTEALINKFQDKFHLALQHQQTKGSRTRVEPAKVKSVV